MAQTAARGWGALRIYLEMIKFEHSIFALPFALTGMLWGAKGWPGTPTFLWILLAMVSCRSSAMAFNRIFDREIDAKNPRTVTRAIPAGLLSLKQVNLFFYASIALFLVAAYQLGPLCLQLSPLALLFVLGYSSTKRFTYLCHVVLGLSLGIAPAAAWIATQNSLTLTPILLFLAVTFWTAGFDVIYSLQDEDFDRENGLFSLPVRFGKKAALSISRCFHVLCVSLLIGAGISYGSVGIWYWTGVAVATSLLFYEQSLVKPNDLSKVNLAFFTLNGFVSLGYFGFVLLDFLARGGR